MGPAKAVAALWTEVRELSLGTTRSIDELLSPPSPLTFLREYVSANKPCFVRGGAAHWPAVAGSLWSSDSYLSAAVGTDRIVSVHLTPDGRADALAPFPGDPSRRCFASACVRRLPIAAALRLIQDPTVVAYLQEQNDCFRTEYGGSALAADVDSELPWASAALGCSPEAVNLWIGDSRSETSFHKDHYENLYAVVAGEKHFLLLPPTDFHRLYVRSYPAARYIGNEGKLELEMEEPGRDVPWCSVDPWPRSEEEAARMREEMPLYFDGPPPFQCTLRPGDVLYLPSMWFHHVRQTPDRSGRTIALNYWYDMRFDVKYAYFNLLQSLRIQSSADDEDGESAKKAAQIEETAALMTVEEREKSGGDDAVPLPEEVACSCSP